MVLRVAFVLVVGCDTEEKPRVVSQDTYPAEYAKAICAVQLDCGFVTDVESCESDVASRWVDKLDLGCFNKPAARECLDTVEWITCAGYEADEWSMCSDVDECV